jgi:hypothetical protein
VIKAHLLDQVAQGLKVFLSFAGKARHDGSAQRRLGEGLPDTPHCVQILGAGPSPCAADFVVAVLDGRSVRQNTGLYYCLNNPNDAGRMAIQKANPPESINLPVPE